MARDALPVRRQAEPDRCRRDYLLCGGSPTLLGFYNENRGPSDGVVFDSSCQPTTGIGHVAGSTMIVGDNHLMLGWESTAMHAVGGWLSS